METQATLISTKVFHHIARKQLDGTIHSRFDNAINIRLEDGLIFNILPDTFPPNSRSLLLPLRAWNRTKRLRFSDKLAVYIKDNQIRIPTLAVRISFRRSRLWDPSPSLPALPAPSINIRGNLEIVLRVVMQSSENGDSMKNQVLEPLGIFGKIPYGSISRSSRHAFIRMISEGANDLNAAISSLDFQGVSGASRRIMGLGPGLTPSGDDFLAGVMAAGVFMSLAYEELHSTLEKINFSIFHSNLAGTTTYGQILLNDAKRGEVVRPLGQLLQGILCGDEVAFLVSLTHEVMALGESSGKDSLVGIIFGMELFLRLREDEGHLKK